MKKVFLIGLTSLLIYSCTTEEPDFNNGKSLTISNEYLQLDYQGAIDSHGMLNLVLNLVSQQNTSSYHMKLDVKSKAYRLDISSTLRSEAMILAQSVTKTQAKLISETITEFINAYDNPVDFKNEELQGLFYYCSVFNAINRYHATRQFNPNASVDGIQITPYNGYITGLSPYMAKEDITLDISDFKNYLKNYSLSRLTKEDISYIMNEVGNRQSMTLKGYEELVHTPLKINARGNSRGNGCTFLCGNECGCCGNYAGQCYYGNSGCYVHDYLCQTCTPRWFCFSGCRPGPC